MSSTSSASMEIASATLAFVHSTFVMVVLSLGILRPDGGSRTSLGDFCAGLRKGLCFVHSQDPLGVW